MSPMKNPKFSVAASSTKKPKTTFSRFMPLTPGVVVAHHCREKLSHLLTQGRSHHFDDGRAAGQMPSARRHGPSGGSPVAYERLSPTAAGTVGRRFVDGAGPWRRPDPRADVVTS